MFFITLVSLGSNAIIVPYHHEFVMPDWKMQICSENYTTTTDLVLFLAKEFYGPEKSIEELDKEKWDCFQNVFITSGHLSDEDNVYNKEGREVDPWWNRGPNHAFYKILLYAIEQNYTKFFLMETDTHPQRENWLEELDFYFDLDNYYILGGGINSELRNAWEDYEMPSYYINHINGNAIYNLSPDTMHKVTNQFVEYVTNCYTCGKRAKNLFPYFISSRLSFDIFFSYWFEMIGYQGYVVDSDFMENFAGTVTSTEKNSTSLFLHQNSGYEFAKATEFGVMNLTNAENKNPCKSQIPSTPFLIVDDNQLNRSKFIPTTNEVRYVLNALPRNSSYCKDKCLEETEFCANEEDCYYINTEAIVYWPLDVYIDCATRGELPHGSEYVTLHKERYMLLDRSKVIVEHPLDKSFSHVPVLAASAGTPLTNTQIGIIVGSSLGGILFCCFAIYLCRRCRRNEQ